jgi:hypothetical protein
MYRYEELSLLYDGICYWLMHKIEVLLWKYYSKPVLLTLLLIFLIRYKYSVVHQSRN